MTPSVFSATLTDACGEDPRFFCELLFDATENETLAEIVGLLLDRPLRILLILLGAWILNRIMRRLVDRFVKRLSDRYHEERNKEEHHSTLLNFGHKAAITLERLRERRERSEQRIQTIASVMKSIGTVLIMGIALLLCLGELGIDLAPLIAGAGIAGLAVGFGAQSLVRDFFSGIFILVEDQFSVGDVVDVGDASGTVEKVSLRTTTLRDVHGVVWTVPNGEIARTANKSQLWSRAILDIGVSYDTDIDHASRIMKAEADELWQENRPDATVLEEPAVWGVQELGNDSVVIRLVVKTDPSEQWGVERILRARIKKAFDRAGIEIPFPQRTVWLRNDPWVQRMLSEDQQDAAQDPADTLGTPGGADGEDG